MLYDSIVSVSWEESVNSDSDNISPGAVCAGAIDAEFWVTSDGAMQVSQGSAMTYYKVDADTGVETQIGIFTCEKPEMSGGNKYKVTAYDNITKLDVDVSEWLNGLTFPVTIDNFAKNLATKCGLSLPDSAPINGSFPIQAFTSQSTTGRDLMKMVAQATGSFIYADAKGVLRYGWYKTNSNLRIAPYKSYGGKAFLFDIIPRQLQDDVPRELMSTEPDGSYNKPAGDKDKKQLNDKNVVKLRTGDVVEVPETTPYFSGQLTFSDFTVAKIDKVQVKQSDDDVGVIYPADATGTNALVIQGNKLLIASSDSALRPYVKNLYDRLSNMVYVPCSNIQTPDTIEIRAGDIVTVTDGKREFVTYMTSLKHTGSKCTYESVGSANRNTTTAVNNAKYSTKQKMLEISTSIDGLNIKASQIEKKTDDLGNELDQTSTQLTEQYTQLKQTFDTFEVTAVTDGNVRSKFALDHTSVTISSGVITFSGNTLVVNSDNFKLQQDGTVAITGTFTSETSTDKAYVGNGQIELSKVSGSTQYSTIKLYSTGDISSALGHIELFGEQGDKRAELYTDQAGSHFKMYYYHGSDNDKPFFYARADGNGEGHVSIGGVNGLGYLECKRLMIDSHKVALARVNYTNEQGTPTWEYLLTAHQGDAW